MCGSLLEYAILLHSMISCIQSSQLQLSTNTKTSRGQSNEGQEGTGREEWGIREGAGGGSDVSDAVLSLRAGESPFLNQHPSTSQPSHKPHSTNVPLTVTIKVKRNLT